MTSSIDIHQLLPFYVNGTLSKEEHDLVERYIKDHPEIQEEIDFLSALRMNMQSLPQENSPGELGLKRLQRALEREKLKDNPIARAESKIAKEQNWVWRAAAIAACLLLMLQTVVTFPMWRSGDLSAASGPSITQEMPVIAITFAPQATEAEIRDLLIGLKLTIVDGPSALGVYRLSVGADLNKVVGVLGVDERVESVQVED